MTVFHHGATKTCGWCYLTESLCPSKADFCTCKAQYKGVKPNFDDQMDIIEEESEKFKEKDELEGSQSFENEKENIECEISIDRVDEENTSINSVNGSMPLMLQVGNHKFSPSIEKNPLSSSMSEGHLSSSIKFSEAVKSSPNRVLKRPAMESTGITPPNKACLALTL